jgi:hypothetical protein
MMRYLQNEERQRILRQALTAKSLCEIDAATLELREWVSTHPDDLGIVDAFEQLDLMRRAVMELESSSPSPAAS